MCEIICLCLYECHVHVCDCGRTTSIVMIKPVYSCCMYTGSIVFILLLLVSVLLVVCGFLAIWAWWIADLVIFATNQRLSGNGCTLTANLWGQHMNVIYNWQVPLYLFTSHCQVYVTSRGHCVCVPVLVSVVHLCTLCCSLLLSFVTLGGASNHMNLSAVNASYTCSGCSDSQMAPESMWLDANDTSSHWNWEHCCAG